MDALADGILVGEILLSKNLIHYDHARRVLIILVRDETSASERNPHHLQIIRSDNIVDGPTHLVLTGWFRLSFEPEESLVVTGQGQRTGG